MVLERKKKNERLNGRKKELSKEQNKKAKERTN